MTQLVLPTTSVPSPLEAPGLRWGVVSPGGIAHKFVSTMHDATRSRLVAVCSRSQQRAEAFARAHTPADADPQPGRPTGHAETSAANRPAAYSDINDFLADPAVDAVYLACPHGQHYEMALPIIAAGKPVVIEKAFTLNAAQARELFALAKERGSFVMEAMWSRFLPHYDVVRQCIEQGLIGEVTGVVAEHGQFFPFDPEHRLFDPHLGGGALLDLGVYPLSFAHWVAGPLEDVTALGCLTQTGVDDSFALVGRGTGSVAGRPECGPTVSIQSTLSARTPNTASVIGREGRIDITQRFYAPAPFTLTRFAPERYGTDEIAQFSYEDSLPYALPTPSAGRDVGMAFEIAAAARAISAGAHETEQIRWADTVEIMETMDEIRRQLGVAYPQEQ